MTYKVLLTVLSFFISIILISQTTDTIYYKNKKFSKQTVERKGKYMTIVQTGPMIQKSNYSLDPIELISSYSYKAEDSSNYWRSVEIVGDIKKTRTQNDSTQEVVERDSHTNDLIGIAKYKIKWSKGDRKAIQMIKNQENLYNDRKITLPLFNKEVDFHQYIILAGEPIRGFRPKIEHGKEFVEGNIIMRIDFDENAKIKDLLILEGYISEIDMGYYIAAYKEAQWEKAAMKNGVPIEFTYYLNLSYRHYTPLFIKDSNY